ncbi:hypothetical protein GINT2_000690 [Glugoides intestinalis]
MSLKDKVFRFGIYGKEASCLSKAELEELKSKKWAEILSKDQIAVFTANFTLSPFKSYDAKGDVPNDYIVRMNLHAWRAYLLGPDFITTNKNYFVIVDYLLHEQGFVQCSVLRTRFSIDPKTMHYICKKLRLKNVIIEKKENSESSIALGPIRNREADEKAEKSVMVNTAPMNTSDFIFYNNLSLINQLKIHVLVAENGFGTRELNKMTGMKLKIALKHLQNLCETFNTDFKMVESIEHGHTTFKVFHINNLLKRNAKKLEEMKSLNGNTIDPVLSSSDRQEALKLIAEKYGHFVLSGQVMDEITKMTGYPYRIDRKNLISNAKNAGLKVFKLPELFKQRYIITLPIYDESVIKLYCTSHDVSVEESKFIRTVRKYFLNIERCVVADNGYCNDPQTAAYFLYGFLVKNLCSSFDFQTVMMMDIRCLFKITKIRRPNFVAKCAFEIFEKNPKRFNVDESALQNLFEGEIEPKKLNVAIFDVIEELEDMKTGEFISLISQPFQETLREACKPHRYLKKLQSLENKGLIELKIDEKERIGININNDKIRSLDLVAKDTSILPTTLKYNSRVEFIQRIRHSTRENFREEAEKIIANLFSRFEQKIIKNYISLFLKENEGNIKDKKLPIGNSPTLKETQHELYLLIKKALVFGVLIDFRILTGYENVDIEDVLEYMAYMELISGFRSISTLSKTYISIKFKAFLTINTEIIDNPIPISNREYFELIYEKLYSIIKEAGSIDFDNLVQRSKYFEPFEIKMFLKEYENAFSIQKIGDFEFIFLSGVPDPFDF